LTQWSRLPIANPLKESWRKRVAMRGGSAVVALLCGAIIAAMRTGAEPDATARRFQIVGVTESRGGEPAARS